MYTKLAPRPLQSLPTGEFYGMILVSLSVDFESLTTIALVVFSRRYWQTNKVTNTHTQKKTISCKLPPGEGNRLFKIYIIIIIIIVIIINDSIYPAVSKDSRTGKCICPKLITMMSLYLENKIIELYVMYYMQCTKYSSFLKQLLYPFFLLD